MMTAHFTVVRMEPMIAMVALLEMVVAPMAVVAASILIMVHKLENLSGYIAIVMTITKYAMLEHNSVTITVLYTAAIKVQMVVLEAQMVVSTVIMVEILIATEAKVDLTP